MQPWKRLRRLRCHCKLSILSACIPVQLADGKEIKLGPGEHSELIKAIIENFGARYVPGGQLIYVGDTSDKWGYFDAALLAELGVKVDSHGKMPDVVLY